jgi:hypothetical protein
MGGSLLKFGDSNSFSAFHDSFRIHIGSYKTPGETMTSEDHYESKDPGPVAYLPIVVPKKEVELVLSPLELDAA